MAQLHIVVALATAAIILTFTPPSEANEEPRYYTEANGRYLSELLAEYGAELDLHPALRRKYPRDSFMVIGSGAMIVSDDRRGGACSARFTIKGYGFNSGGEAFLTLDSVISGALSNRLAYGNGIVDERSMSDDCARGAMQSLLSRM